MADFKDHILYAVISVAVLGCVTALTITGNLDKEAAVALMGAILPTGLGLKANSSDSSGTTDNTSDRTI